MSKPLAGWGAALRRTYRRAHHRVLLLVRRWRSSMQLQVVSTALIVSLVSMAALGGYLTSSIRDGLFTQRLDQLLIESARSTEQAQATFDASSANSADQVQQLLNDMILRMRSSGSGSREVFLWRPENSLAPISVIDRNTAPELSGLITTELRHRTTSEEGQHWQSVGLPGDSAEPGIVVGSVVEVPLAGEFEMYYLYSLDSEQQTLAFIERVLLVGAVTLVALLGLLTYILARQAVRPVRQAARVAEKLAAGLLDERMVVRGQDEMATLARSFNAMASSLQDQIERMEDLSKLQRRFVSDVSHELRTPLTTIRMAGEMLYDLREDFDPTSKRSAELLMLQLDRFEDLLGDLLEISRFDAGAATLDAERRDMRDVADRAVDQAMHLAGRKGVWLSAHYPAEPATADIDPRRVERILRNLLVNAVEHAEGGPVEITVGVNEYAVAVTVRDFGVGMLHYDAEHVFDRFFRADPARARTSGGTGLGLAISLEDARLHDGWLQAWGDPGNGSSFRFTVARRAGIVLRGSPLPLTPEAMHPRATTAGAVPTTESVPHEETAMYGPSSVPDLSRLDGGH